MSDAEECYRRAEKCGQRAAETRDPAVRQDYLDMQRCWLSLAHSYELTERISDLCEK
jgi:hypothetical protein